MSQPLTPHPTLPIRGGRKYVVAFTLAEVLITLVIIGIIAAITVPVIMQNVKKQEVETKLKQEYSLLHQVVKRAEVDHGAMTGWDFSMGENFVNTYFIPYLTSNFKKIKYSTYDRYSLTFTNGIQWEVTPLGHDMVGVYVDINGDKQPNEFGRDKFNFYLVQRAGNTFNAANGDIMYDVPAAGIYYDGHKINKWNKNAHYTNTHRGCKSEKTYHYVGAYCTALIVENGFKIPKNYPLKL